MTVTRVHLYIFDIVLSAEYALEYIGAAVWNGSLTRDAWYSYERPCHETALSHCVHPAAAPTRAVQIVVGESEHTTCKDIRSGIRASALTRSGPREPSHGIHGRNHAATPRNQYNDQPSRGPLREAMRRYRSQTKRHHDEATQKTQYPYTAKPMPHQVSQHTHDA